MRTVTNNIFQAWQTSSQKANTINEKQKCEHANPQKDGREGG
jgi:hypothetical protein